MRIHLSANITAVRYKDIHNKIIHWLKTRIVPFSFFYGIHNLDLAEMWCRKHTLTEK